MDFSSFLFFYILSNLDRAQSLFSLWNMIFTFVLVELALFSNHAVNKNNKLILGTIEPTYTWTCLKAS